MLYAHDAATGYISATGDNTIVLPGAPSDVFGIISNDGPRKKALSQNQVGDFKAQLDCGARGLNVRPQVHDGRLVMHHGFVAVDTLFATALLDVVTWAEANPKELVVLGVTDCDGPDCLALATAAMETKGIKVYSACSVTSVLRNLTVTQARTEGQLITGGSVVAFTESCIEQNYNETDPDLARCYPAFTPGAPPPIFGRRRLALAVAAARESESEAARRKLQMAGSCYIRAPATYATLKSSVVAQTAAGKLAETKLTHQNAHWHYLNTDMQAQTLLGSSIVVDNVRSKVNEFVTGLVAADLKEINLLQVDNVCQNGPKIAQAIKAKAVVDGLRLADAVNATAAPTKAPTRAPVAVVVTSAPTQAPVNVIDPPVTGTDTSNNENDNNPAAALSASSVAVLSVVVVAIAAAYN